MKNHIINLKKRKKLIVKVFSQLPSGKKCYKSLYYFGEQIISFLAQVVEMLGKREAGGQTLGSMTTPVTSNVGLCLVSSRIRMCPLPFTKGAVGNARSMQTLCLCPSLRGICVNQVKDWPQTHKLAPSLPPTWVSSLSH